MEVLDMLNTRIDGRILSLSFLSKKSERDIHDFKGLHCASFLQSLELKKKKKKISRTPHQSTESTRDQYGN